MPRAACSAVRGDATVPTAPPQNVRTEAVNSTAIRFLWTPPPQQFVNGINQGYKVRLSRPRVPVPWAVRGPPGPGCDRSQSALTS